jgi:hypothetical protein
MSRSDDEAELLAALTAALDHFEAGLASSTLEHEGTKILLAWARRDLPRRTRSALRGYGDCGKIGPDGPVDNFLTMMRGIMAHIEEGLARARATRGGDRRSLYAQQPKPEEMRQQFSEGYPVTALDILEAAARSRGEEFDADAVARRNNWPPRRR